MNQYYQRIINLKAQTQCVLSLTLDFSASLVSCRLWQCHSGTGCRISCSRRGVASHSSQCLNEWRSERALALSWIVLCCWQESNIILFTKFMIFNMSNWSSRKANEDRFSSTQEVRQVEERDNRGGRGWFTHDNTSRTYLTKAVSLLPYADWHCPWTPPLGALHLGFRMKCR